MLPVERVHPQVYASSSRRVAQTNVARSKQLPRAQGATRGDLGGGFPAVVYIACERRKTETLQHRGLLPRSSSWASRYFDCPWPSLGANSRRMTAISTPGSRLADATGTPGKGKCMEMKKPSDRGSHRKGSRLACCSGILGALFLGSCRVRPQLPSPTRSFGFCVIWVSISPGSSSFKSKKGPTPGGGLGPLGPS